MKARMILIRTAAAAALLAAMPLVAVAADATTTPKVQNQAQTQRLTNLKAKGTTEIDRRLSGLTAALEKLSAATKVAAADKANLTKQLQDEIAGLTALKTKLAADTELAAARADVQSIVTDYRVYALMLPKARLVASADRFTVAEDKLLALHDQLQQQVSDHRNSPTTDISPEQAKLHDMLAKINSAKSRIDGLTAKILALQPTDYNANHALLASYRDALKSAQTDLKAARDDAKAVIDMLKS